MEHTTLNNWKNLLEKIEQEDHKVTPGDLRELESLFRHLPTQIAPRLLNDYHDCTIRSKTLFASLFDRIDLSDKNLLCKFLQMLGSFGFFRLSQIAYRIPGPLDESSPDSIYVPSIERMRWYELRPLLSEAGSIGWKGVMNIGLVRDETELSQACLVLLKQKLQFLSILLTLPHYTFNYCEIRTVGKKTAEKLLELIKDSAFVDEVFVRPDPLLVQLLCHFIEPDDQNVLLSALVQNLFKQQLAGQPIGKNELEIIDEIMKPNIIDKAKPQSFVFSKLFEHLRGNIIRRKRRHSVEASMSENEASLEKFLLQVEQTSDIRQTLSDLDSFRVSSKKFQTKYLEYWLEIVAKIQLDSPIASVNSVKIIGICSILLVAAAPALDGDLIDSLYSLMIHTIENSTPYGTDHIFNRCNAEFMIEFIKLLFDSENLSLKRELMFNLYRILIRRFIRACAARNKKEEVTKFNQFIEYICGDNLDRESSQQLQSICVKELANFMSDPKAKISNTLSEEFRISSLTCCEKLLKYVKKYACPKRDHSESNNQAESIDEQSEQERDLSARTRKREAAIETLLAILKLAISKEDKNLLDSYSNPLVKIFEMTKLRIQELARTTQHGACTKPTPLDKSLTRFVALYFDHRDIIQGYLDGDFKTEISLSILEEPIITEDSTVSQQHKGIYNQLKQDLNNLKERASKSDQIYFTLINRQFTSIEPNIMNGNSIEEVCCKDIREQLNIISDICAKVIANCDQIIYKKIMSSLQAHFENCDPLDHPKFIYLMIILETLIPSHDDPPRKIEIFDENLPNLSCCLMKIMKTVQYGPSIYTFKKSGGHKTNISIQCCTYILCMKLYTTLFRKYTPKLANDMIGHVLLVCVSANLSHYAKYSVSLHRLFIQLSVAMSGLLRSLSKKQDIIGSSLPVFLTVFENLIRCLIIASDRQKLNQLQAPTNGNKISDQNNNFASEKTLYETRLEELAIDVGRTLNNISGWRVKMVNFAPHLISSFIQNIQRASCPESIKVHLSEGIFRIFNLVDAHQKERLESVVEAGVQRKTNAGRASGSLFEMIHARLDQASREVFRDLHDNYNRFHKYQAKC